MTGQLLHEPHHDGPDTFDFRLSVFPPASDWGRDGVVYQIFPTGSPGRRSPRYPLA